jgi:hypothetical protein
MSGLPLHKSPFSLAEMAWMTQKVNEIKQHAAWHEDLNEAGSERLLQNEPVWTYVLRPGKDMRHYFLSYVETDQTVQHKQVKIELSVRGWLYHNGGGNIREHINDLIPVAIHATAEQCRPYRAPRISLFSLS